MLFIIAMCTILLHLVLLCILLTFKNRLHFVQLLIFSTWSSEIVFDVKRVWLMLSWPRFRSVQFHIQLFDRTHFILTEKLKTWKACEDQYSMYGTFGVYFNISIQSVRVLTWINVVFVLFLGIKCCWSL